MILTNGQRGSKEGGKRESEDGRGPSIPLPACLQTLDYRAGVVDNGSGPISLARKREGGCPYQVSTTVFSPSL